MSNHILLESRFTIHQKTHIVLTLGAPFIIAIILLIRINLNSKGYLVLFALIIVYSAMVCLAFAKRGLLKKDTDIYRGLFFANKLLLKKKIDLTNKPNVSILKFKKIQKMAWFSVARPDLATEFNVFDITLLNDRHTQKESLISVSNHILAKKTIDYLTNNFNLNFEIYSPDFT